MLAHFQHGFYIPKRGDIITLTRDLEIILSRLDSDNTSVLLNAHSHAEAVQFMEDLQNQIHNSFNPLDKEFLELRLLKALNAVQSFIKKEESKIDFEDYEIPFD